MDVNEDIEIQVVTPLKPIGETSKKSKRQDVDGEHSISFENQRI